jgi:sphinganine C4-monooxygenase
MALLRPFPFLPPPAFNSSLLHDMSPSDPLAYPFYRSDKQSLIPGLSDRYTALAVPIIVYWFLSALFHLLDVLQLPYFEARRIHESAEVTRRNRVTLPQVSRT